MVNLLEIPNPLPGLLEWVLAVANLPFYVHFLGNLRAGFDRFPVDFEVSVLVWFWFRHVWDLWLLAHGRATVYLARFPWSEFVWFLNDLWVLCRFGKRLLLQQIAHHGECLALLVSILSIFVIVMLTLIIVIYDFILILLHLFSHHLMGVLASTRPASHIRLIS